MPVNRLFPHNSIHNGPPAFSHFILDRFEALASVADQHDAGELIVQAPQGQGQTLVAGCLGKQEVEPPIFIGVAGIRRVVIPDVTAVNIFKCRQLGIFKGDANLVFKCAYVGFSKYLRRHVQAIEYDILLNIFKY